MVREITADQVTVENQYGDKMHVSPNILEKMDSADHFEKEVPMTMTELAETLQSAGDTVFTVRFHKKPTDDTIMSELEKTPFNDFKNQATLSKLAKSMIEGEDCLMHCHLVKCENGLGRSTVIDLGSKSDNKFRQVDHRTIEHIIIHNTKYILKKGSKKANQDVDMDASDKKKPKWDAKKLAVGNWFSGTRYFRSVEESGTQIKMRSEA